MTYFHIQETQVGDPTSKGTRPYPNTENTIIYHNGVKKSSLTVLPLIKLQVQTIWVRGVLKECRVEIAEMLSCIFSLTLSLAYMPADWSSGQWGSYIQLTRYLELAYLE